MFKKNNNTKTFIILLVVFFNSRIAYPQSSKRIAEISVPDGYERVTIAKNKFGNWIRNLPLKPSNSVVHDFRGNIFKKSNDTTVAAVVDWNIKKKRLEQCMDILVRFYAEYLWKSDSTDNLILPLPGGQSLKWIDWRQGFRPKFKRINFKLIKSGEINSTKRNYDRYLNLIFAESHTQQFYFAYPKIERENVQIGDFIVKKGVKGHAVMIVDLAKNVNGDLVALIGQGDTPACEFYLLNYDKDNPWFPLNFEKNILPLPIKKKMSWEGLRRFGKVKKNSFH